MKTIELTQNQITFISDEDFERVSGYKWFAFFAPSYSGGGKFVAARNVPKPNGKQQHLYLHRFIMNAPQGLIVDHIDGNPLNNKRENLRLATVAENGQNRGKPATNTSGFKGVDFHKGTGKFRAQITVNKKRITLGYFLTASDAACEYDQAAIQHYGEFAQVNFPNKQEN